MRDYETISADAGHYNESSDCAVRAVALVADLPYGYVHAVFARFGRVNRCATFNSVIDAVLKELGLTTREKAHLGGTIGKLRLGPGRYLINTRRHILAAIDGEILDWTKGRRHRTIRVRKIT